MNRIAMLATGAAALAVLTGCQTWSPPYSEISGSRYTRANLDRFPTFINAVDGRNPGPRLGYGRDASYYRVDPGAHVIALQAVNPTPNWVSGINRQEATLTIEPCKRYYINAQFDNRLLADWKPVVDYVEPIAGCGAGGATG